MTKKKERIIGKCGRCESKKNLDKHFESLFEFHDHLTYYCHNCHIKKHEELKKKNKGLTVEQVRIINNIVSLGFILGFLYFFWTGTTILQRLIPALLVGYIVFTKPRLIQHTSEVKSK